MYQPSNASDERGVAFAKELGHTFTEATAEDIAMLREVSDGLIDEWADKVSSGELDAREALEFFRDQLGQVDAEAGIVDRVVTTEG